MSNVMNNLREKMKKSKAVLKESFNTVRAGRANPALLDRIMVDYYGTPTPLKNMSNISAPILEPCRLYLLIQTLWAILKKLSIWQTWA